MAGRERYTLEQVIATIRETRGMLTLAANRLGCAPLTLYRYAQRHKAVQEAIAEQRERMTDIAELKLYAAINNGEPWAIRYYLNCQARSRGYAHKVDLDVHIHQMAEMVAAEFGMTADEILAEAKSFLHEWDHRQQRPPLRVLPAKEGTS